MQKPSSATQGGPDEPARTGEDVEAAPVGAVVRRLAVEHLVVLVHAQAVCRKKKRSQSKGDNFFVIEIAKLTRLNVFRLAQRRDKQLFASASSSRDPERGFPVGRGREGGWRRQLVPQLIILCLNPLLLMLLLLMVLRFQEIGEFILLQRKT